MNRRGFLGFGLAAVGGVFMGRRWYRQGRGLIVPGYLAMHIKPDNLGLGSWEWTNGAAVLQRYEITGADLLRLQRGDTVEVMAAPGPGKAILTANQWRIEFTMA